MYTLPRIRRPLDKIWQYFVKFLKYLCRSCNFSEFFPKFSKNLTKFFQIFSAFFTKKWQFFKILGSFESFLPIFQKIWQLWKFAARALVYASHITIFMEMVVSYVGEKNHRLVHIYLYVYILTYTTKLRRKALTQSADLHLIPAHYPLCRCLHRDFFRKFHRLLFPRSLPVYAFP